MDASAPLAGIRVIEFSHMVMGPTTGAILADLGADVIRVEPPGGDRTRFLLGSGAGYYPMFNRNKRSVCLDLKDEDGRTAALALCDDADVVVENFRSGTLERLGLGHEVLRERNPRLIVCAAKGFLDGPYQDRTALDEVAQMMGGLAYMTGPPGRPLRAGASVVDITGGMFGAVGVLAALERRHRTDEGGYVKCALFETTAYLVGQHMAQQAVTGVAPAPMPQRISAWAVYDIFETAQPNEQLFVGVVSDAQWRTFVSEFDLRDLAADPVLETNNQRVEARDRILPVIREIFAGLSREAIIARLEPLGLPFAAVARPGDLFDDPHLHDSGGLVRVSLNGMSIPLPALPVSIDGKRTTLRRDLGEPGADTQQVLRELRLPDDVRERLLGAQIG